MVGDGERHERADRHVRLAGLDSADVDRVRSDSLRGLRPRELSCRTQRPKSCAEASPFSPGRRDDRGPVSCLRASVPEPRRRHVKRRTAPATPAT